MLEFTANCTVCNHAFLHSYHSRLRALAAFSPRTQHSHESAPSSCRPIIEPVGYYAPARHTPSATRRAHRTRNTTRHTPPFNPGPSWPLDAFPIVALAIVVTVMWMIRSR